MLERPYQCMCLALLFGGSQLVGQVSFDLVDAKTVQARLDLYRGDDHVREAALIKMFADAGCPAANLSEQSVPKLKDSNVICALPGDSAEEIIVGAHFDHVPGSSGVVDNWSGASLLPSLFQSLLASNRKHTFQFIGFTGEESGLVGSTFFVSHLSKSEVSQIRLM